MNTRVLSKHDATELDAFRRFLHMQAWRMKGLGESRFRAMGEAGLEVYGDKGCEGNKHHRKERTHE